MPDTDRPLRVGVVGCGSFGRAAYALNVADSPDACVAALCDTDQSRAEAVAGEIEDRDQSPAIHTDYQQMIDRESLDIVMVATMADLRPRITIQALRAGAHVLAAKPMAPSLPEAEEMLRTAEAVDRTFMVGYNFRFREDSQAIHRFIQDSGLGTPLFARAWSHTAGIPTWGPHYIKSQSAGGALASTAVHPLDLAVWVLGCPPLLSVEGHAGARFADLPDLPPDLEAVRPAYDTEDLVTGYARFENGVTLSLEGMWLTPSQIGNIGVDVWGSHGYASLVPFRLFTWQNGDYVDRTEEIAPGLAAAYRDEVGDRRRVETFHFIDCVLGRTAPLVTPKEMWTDQAIVDGIYAGRCSFDPNSAPG